MDTQEMIQQLYQQIADKMRQDREESCQKIQQEADTQIAEMIDQLKEARDVIVQLTSKLHLVQLEHETQIRQLRQQMVEQQNEAHNQLTIQLTSQRIEAQDRLSVQQKELQERLEAQQKEAQDQIDQLNRTIQDQREQIQCLIQQSDQSKELDLSTTGKRKRLDREQQFAKISYLNDPLCLLSAVAEMQSPIDHESMMMIIDESKDQQIDEYTVDVDQPTNDLTDEVKTIEQGATVNVNPYCTLGRFCQQAAASHNQPPGYLADDWFQDPQLLCRLKQYPSKTLKCEADLPLDFHLTWICHNNLNNGYRCAQRVIEGWRDNLTGRIYDSANLAATAIAQEEGFSNSGIFQQARIIVPALKQPLARLEYLRDPSLKQKRMRAKAIQKKVSKKSSLL